MGIPVMKRCCCLELKWGALIAAIGDWALTGTVVGLTGCKSYLLTHLLKTCPKPLFTDLRFGHDIIWYVAILIHIAHIVGCILVVVSVFVPNKKFVMVYLITGIIRILFDIAFLIYLCILVFNALVVAIIMTIIGIAGHHCYPTLPI
ncbi:uncharacterized protein LOC119549526 isoform X3 [Drosophila subpulchrella]|uniref:uncharacterized protein LOC119549526 isoform X3 n=1 Tax=Drosophila subpulchrella TaxID=1486046 RepID=UPI0018A170EF|nr:uncharacterized protein LOC119549526 isoform X3 [Drosophila subpulchrella]